MDKAKAAEESLRNATREAHEAIKDLRALVTEANKICTKIEEAAQVAVDERLEPVVKAEIEELGKATKRAMDDAVDKVSAEFQKLEDLFLGKDKKSARQGKVTIEQLIERRDQS